MAPKRGRAPPPGFAWGEGPFSAGDEVRYWDAHAGEVCSATVQRVDASVQPPAYAVQLRGGQTRDTEAPRLARVTVVADGVGAAKEAAGEAAAGRSPRRSVRSNGGGGASPQVAKTAGARRSTPRRSAEAAAPAFAEEVHDRSPKRARASPAAAKAGARRRGRAESEEEDADGRRGVGLGLVHIAVTAMAVTTAALAAFKRLQ